jgi:hypothetical protein
MDTDLAEALKAHRRRLEFRMYAVPAAAARALGPKSIKLEVYEIATAAARGLARTRQPGILLSHLVSAAAAGIAAFHLGNFLKWWLGAL